MDGTRRILRLEDRYSRQPRYSSCGGDNHRWGLDESATTSEAPTADLFTIDGTGQIKTKSPLNHEDEACGYDGTADTTSCSYTVRVKVSDNEGGSTVSEQR